jgi:hypothetical protein
MDESSTGIAHNLHDGLRGKRILCRQDRGHQAATANGVA